MAVTGKEDPQSCQTSCGSLLQQFAGMQLIWDEVGETDEERDKMLLQIDQECLDVYKRKVDQASKSKAQFLQILADSRAELARLLSALGETTYDMPEKSTGTIKEQLAEITPFLEELRLQKEERTKDFTDVQSQIQKIRGEISGTLNTDELVMTITVDEDDLSLKKLCGFQSQLQELQREKSDRLHKVLEFASTVHDLCAVLGMDFFSTITEVHLSLDDSVGVQSKSISNETLSKLAGLVLSLKEEKKMRLLKIQELAGQLCDLWNLMDTPDEERDVFNHVTCNISATLDEVALPGSLAFDLIEQAEVEVERLDELKASKMKEIALKKQTELEDIHARAHIEVDSVAAQEKIAALIESNMEPSELLANLDNEIVKAKEEALGRKEILEKVEKWMSACEEESWLEDYNLDHNRYSSSRGAHLNLKRAEKARILVNKIPALVDTLVAKTQTWEDDHGMPFTYDGVPLLAMLDEYAMLRHEREEEKRRMRDQKKFHDQMNKDQETIFVQGPSPNRSLGPKKVDPSRANGTPNRRLSLNSIGSKSMGKRDKRTANDDNNNNNVAAILKEDAAVSSHVSGNGSSPISP